MTIPLRYAVVRKGDANAKLEARGEIYEFSRGCGAGTMKQDELKLIATFPGASEFCWCETGRRLAVLCPEGEIEQGSDRPCSIKVFEGGMTSACGNQLVAELKMPRGARRIALSPFGNFLQYVVKPEEGNVSNDNLFVVDVSDIQKPILSCGLRNYGDRFGLDAFFSPRETFFARRNGDKLYFHILPFALKPSVDIFPDGIEAPHDLESMEGFSEVMTDEGLMERPKTGVKLSKSNPDFNCDVPGVCELNIGRENDDGSFFFSTFVRGVKGASGKIQLRHSLTPDKTRESCTTQNHDCRMVFSSDGQMVVAESSSLQTTKQDKSYYGSSTLHAIRSQGGHVSLVDGDQKPCHGWTIREGYHQVMFSQGRLPANLQFVDLAGRKMGTPLAEFQPERRNTFRFNGPDEFLLSAGFGSLAGDVDIFDMESGRILGCSRQKDTVVAEWFPDGRHIMLATTAPRMRVDNRVRILRYNGEQLHELRFGEQCITFAMPQPMNPLSVRQAVYPKRPADKERPAMRNEEKKKTAFVPPHLRQKTTAVAKKVDPVGKAKFSPARILNYKAITGKDDASMSLGEKKTEEVAKKPGFKMPF